jgi:hypothetical protein
LTSNWYDTEEEMLADEPIPVTGVAADANSFSRQWGRELPEPRPVPLRAVMVVGIISLLLALLGWGLAQAIRAGWLDVSRWLGEAGPEASIGLWLLLGLIGGAVIAWACWLFGPCGKDR